MDFSHANLTLSMETLAYQFVAVMEYYFFGPHRPGLSSALAWRFASREQHKMNAWLWTRRSCWSLRFARLDPGNSLYDAIFLVYFCPIKRVLIRLCASPI